MSFTIGTDPELFTRRQGKISSVAGLLGCSKSEKLHLSQNVRLQEDNVLAEFDINPCKGFEQFDATVQEGLDLTQALLAKHGLEIANGVSSHIFSEEEMKSFHKSAFEFGCTPDYNAFTGRQNASPSAADPGLRTAGGHIHIGYAETIPVTKQNQLTAGVLCDYFHSLPAMFMDGDERRKELYGKAGAIRFKDYGIEYRSLSNFWVTDKNLRRVIYDQTEKVVQFLGTDKLLQLNSLLPVQRLQTIINTNDKRTAESFLSRLGII